MDFSYRFPVVSGLQAKKTYYIAMVPLRMVSKLFPSDEEYVSPEFRAQRRLNESRIPVISRYIVDNRDSYVFSALAASIDGDFKFIENKDIKNTGILEVSMDAKFLINDGQHRKAAILNALKEDESLADETISVVFFADEGLRRSQQIFTDLNKHAVKTSNSISELYDSRDSLAVLTRNVISKVEFLNEYTDFEKDILGKYSSNLFTLNNFYKANMAIIHSKNAKHCDEEFVFEFWNIVSKNMKQWIELRNQEITKKDLREQYIATQNVVIQALGRIGGYLYENREYSLEKYLSKLIKINWKRIAQVWRLRTIKVDAKIITNQNAILLTANLIKKKLGIPLTNDEMIKENKFISEHRLSEGE
jgi:DNA sulfur modification protein DndB